MHHPQQKDTAQAVGIIQVDFMKFFKWIVIILATLNFGYMTYDGSRALIVGDYLRPQTGEYAEQLGPWVNVVQAIGIQPESDLMKYIFLLWGTLGLIVTVSYAMKVTQAGKALLLLNVFSLWYLIAGTISSIMQIILLLLLNRRKH